MTIRNHGPIGLSVTCRSNETLRLWVVSMNEQMACEMRMHNSKWNQWRERIIAHVKWMNDWMNDHAWMNERMNERTNKWMNEWMTEWLNDWMNEWLTEWMNEWMNKRTNEQRNKQMNERANARVSASMNGGMDDCISGSTTASSLSPFPMPSVQAFSKRLLHQATSSLRFSDFSQLFLLWTASYLGYFFCDPLPLSYLPLSATASPGYLFCSSCDPILLLAQPLQCVYEPHSARAAT